MKKVFLLIFAVLIMCTACTNKKDEVIVFDNTNPLALAPDVSWALITDAYTSYKETVDWNGTVTGHCRKGEILQVLGKSLDKEGNEWYKFESGWLPATCLTIYSNRYKAQNAADALKE